MGGRQELNTAIPQRARVCGSQELDPGMGQQPEVPPRRLGTMYERDLSHLPTILSVVAKSSKKKLKIILSYLILFMTKS